MRQDYGHAFALETIHGVRPELVNMFQVNEGVRCEAPDRTNYHTFAHYHRKHKVPEDRVTTKCLTLMVGKYCASVLALLPTVADADREKHG